MDDKKLTMVLTLSDVAEGLGTMAEGLGTMIEAMKLVSSGLDDVANLIRETLEVEEKQ